MLAALAAAACGGGGGGDAPTAPGPAVLALTLAGVGPLDPAREGHYAAWLIAGGDVRPAGRVQLGADGSATVPIAERPARVDSVLVTVEPPGDADPGPSAQRLLVGALRGGRATLGVTGALTRGALPLQERPGQFTLFTTSNNARLGYPSYEEAGVWLFNIVPNETPQRDTWVRLAQLAPAWTYEGWVVRDLGASNAVWLSYGKFVTDDGGAVAEKDDDGWGPLSGIPDYLTAGIDNFPGSDFLANPLGLPLPAGVTLPLDLRERDAAGGSRWSHVITIEPATERGEAMGAARPFLVRPYRDPFGDAGAGRPRAITYRPDGVPHGTAELR
ncbi:hypothetical protein rosag_16210 [Roseisolibacter agri]|uniref:Anti-sigma K factor RskA C-terminal domain-containing protein n=1 Tax=Roseisolibacter agri TaxID=2014610 RepID=A0AA37VA61_9BACT|nr:hypothetical protein rosag_16210 [Roseisolibacter agri]